MTLTDLVTRWRREADAYARDGQPGAALLRRVATELEETRRQHELEELSVKDAAVERGCDPSTIRRRFPGRKRITRAELWGKGTGGPDLARRVLRESVR